MTNLEEDSRIIITTEDYIYLENKNLTIQAGLIFGDIVKNAFVVIDKSDNSKARLEAVLNTNEIKVNEYSSFNYNCSTIAIEFTNGNYVEFRNSEWASMTNINKYFDGEK